LGEGIFLALPISIRIGVHPEFTLCVVSLGLAVLAGLGASRFLRRKSLLALAGIVISADLLAVSSGRALRPGQSDLRAGDHARLN